MASYKAGNIPRIARNGRAGLPQFVVRTKGSGNQLCDACRLREPRVDEGRPGDRRYLPLGSRTPRPGAYSHVARRVGAAIDEEMMLGRRIYTAEEMKDVGLVHILAEPGQGIAEAREYIQRTKRRHIGSRCVYQVGREVKSDFARRARPYRPGLG
jgi:hypothetical protein